MPLVEITLIEGRTPETLRTLVHETHEAVQRSLDVSPGSVTVVLREVPATHWATGDTTVAERRAAAAASEGQAAVAAWDMGR